MEKYDYLIVGSGLFGSTFAYMAKKQGKKCLVIDKRTQLGGNIYCENIEGINVHKYGAHIFHTSNKNVWDFVNSIVEFNRYTNSPVANYKGKLYNLPFNMNTFYQMWGVTTPDDAQAKIDEQKAEAVARMKADGVTEPRNLEEQAQVLIGKDIYEKLKAQKALKNTLERLYGLNVEKDLNKLLSYKFSSIAQLELLLKRNGFKLLANKQDETALDILKNGINEKTIYGNQITFNNERNHHREKQIKAILNKYKEIYSTQVFITEDNRENEGVIPGENNAEKKGQVKIEFESELQKKMKDMFGLDIVFNNKDNKTPFGYTIIDHKSQKIFKGSDIIKMNNLFEFTEDKIDKRTFESLKDFNVIDENSKKILLNYFAKNGVKDFMLFENKKRKDWETFKKIQSDFREYSKTQQNPNVSIIKGDDGKFYAIHEKYHYVAELKTIIGDKDYQTFINPSINEQETTTKNQKANEIIEGIKNIGKEFLKSSGTGTSKDHFRTNDELKRKRKKRK